jgi:hypothetical protein
MPDEDLVASHICSSSLVISSEGESKEIRVPQVVYHCLQKVILHEVKKDTLDMILAFSAVDSFDLDKTIP